MSEHNCNCGHDNCNCHDEEVTVTLTLDNDEEVECVVLTIYEAGGKEYIALLPIDEDGDNEEGDVYLYRYAEVDGEPTLDNIEDDDEYEVAADAFDEWLDAQEYEELQRRPLMSDVFFVTFFYSSVSNLSLLFFRPRIVPRLTASPPKSNVNGVASPVLTGLFGLFGLFAP